MFKPDLDDIQGNILRGYHMTNARHFAVSFRSCPDARRLLSKAISGDSGVPQITTAAPWATTPEYCFNVGLTAHGLEKLLQSDAIVRLFPKSFLLGPTNQADALGDDGPSAPENWEFGGPQMQPPIDAMFSLYANKVSEGYGDSVGSERIDAAEAALTKACELHQIEIVWSGSACALPGDAEHFGFRDGIAQPAIEGVDLGEVRDMQPKSKLGEFLLGHRYMNQFGGNFIGDLPEELAGNGSYGAFRMLHQDVGSFRAYCRQVSQRHEMSNELVAAKLMGRWHDGTPLMRAPDDNAYRKLQAGGGLPPAEINEFDYRPKDDNDTYFDDTAGMRCPVNAHVRRMNPRSALVMGRPHMRRIVRRNLPYGPPLDETSDGDDESRGLMGYFICGDLEAQYEFLLKLWANMDVITAGARGIRDPIIGAQEPQGGRFVIRTRDGRDPIGLDDLPRFVVTKGSVYCFLPSISGIRYLTSVSG